MFLRRFIVGVARSCLAGFRVSLVFCLLLHGLGEAAQESEKQVLRILNWSEYIAIDDTVSEEMPIELASPILREFAEINDCRIEYFEYEESSEMMRLASLMTGYFDVIISSEGETLKLVGSSLVEELDRTRLLNFENLDTKYLERMDLRARGVAVPYLMGTTGIAYRSDLVSGKIDSLRDVFYPDPYLKGKVGLLGDQKIVFALLLTAMGFDANESGEAEYRLAAARLNDLKEEDFLGLVDSSVEANVKALNEGSIAMTILFSGDALSASERNPLIEYVVPLEGSEGFIDMMTISSSSVRKDLAYRFVDYILDREIGALNARTLKYATPNAASRAIIERDYPEQIEDAAIYPPRELEDRLFEIDVVPDMASSFWESIFY